MNKPSIRGLARWSASLVVLAALASPAFAGKLSWLDEVIQQTIRETEAGGQVVARAEGRVAGRLLLKDADESLEQIARRSDDMARALGRNADTPAESALRVRFGKLVPADAELARTFSALRPAEKRLVVEMAETAQRLARRYPGQAETMVRQLGVEGLTAVRVYGDEVAEVLVREGPQSLNVLRRTGRAGWTFFTGTVLPHKGKLAAAGVLALFLANPEQFVDTAGRATQYAVEQFAKAGIQLAGAVGAGAVNGLGTAIGSTLARYGIHSEAARWVGVGLACLAAAAAALVLLGLPLRWLARPVIWPFRLVRRLAGKPARVA